MRIEIEHKEGEIHVLLTRTGKQSHFHAKASEAKATVIFSQIMATAAELFKSIKE